MAYKVFNMRKRTFQALITTAPFYLFALACGPQAAGQERKQPTTQTAKHQPASKLATFAGGCFWCVEPPFDKTPGVLETTVGYTGGQEKNPTYKQVSAGLTGHLEAIQVRYDPKKVSYEKLLEVFWRNIDPTDERWPVCRPRQTVPHSDLLPQRQAKKDLLGPHEKSLRKAAFFRSPSTRPYALPEPSTRPRSTIRTTTKRAQGTTTATEAARDAMPLSGRLGLETT